MALKTGSNAEIVRQMIAQWKAEHPEHQDDAAYPTELLTKVAKELNRSTSLMRNYLRDWWPRVQAGGAIKDKTAAAAAAAAAAPTVQPTAPQPSGSLIDLSATRMATRVALS